MKRFLTMWGVLIGIALGNGLAAGSETLETMDDVGTAVTACWKPPPNIEGAVTLSFSFRRNGTLLGSPRASAINVQGDESQRDQFTTAAIDAVKSCTPLNFSPRLAEGMGGQVFTMPFSSTEKPAIVVPK